MPTRRGWVAFGAGVLVWAAARIAGSADLYMLAAGLVALPFLAALFVRWSRVRFEVRRQLSAPRVFPGMRIRVDLTVTNHGRTTSSFLLLEDTVPPALGRSARLVVSGIPPRNEQTVSYMLVPRTRGRYRIGPMTIFLNDPFGLARARLETEVVSDLVVFPEVEPLEPRQLSMQGAGAGETAVRVLQRSAADFYTMREYVTGDDLRRIHWPSVARTGELMIRQDEATRRSAGTLFLDNRSAALGSHGSPAFERAVSAAASIGVALSRTGFALHLATSESNLTPVAEEQLLERLAAVTATRARTVTDALNRLRSTAVTDSALGLVSGIPSGAEVPAILRAGTGFGRRVAVLVYPPTGQGRNEARKELEGRASAARTSLQRAGWEVHVLEPEGRLAATWRSRKTKLRPVGTSS